MEKKENKETGKKKKKTEGDKAEKVEKEKTKEKETFQAGTPLGECRDKHCPFHAGFSLRGRTFTGTVKKVNINQTANVEWTHYSPLKKYERYEIKRSGAKAHVPQCINVEPNDKVVISESRPISKTKHFVITSIIGKVKSEPVMPDILKKEADKGKESDAAKPKEENR